MDLTNPLKNKQNETAPAAAATVEPAKPKLKGIIYERPPYAPVDGHIVGVMEKGAIEGSITRTDYIRWLFMEATDTFNNMADKSLNGKPNEFYKDRRVITDHVNTIETDKDIAYQTIQQACRPYGKVDNPRIEARKAKKLEDAEKAAAEREVKKAEKAEAKKAAEAKAEEERVAREAAKKVKAATANAAAGNAG